MTRLDRILLGLAYVSLILISAFGVNKIQNSLEHAEDRRCDIEKVQLASLGVILKSVQLDPDTNAEVLIARVEQLTDTVKNDCDEE